MPYLLPACRTAGTLEKITYNICDMLLLRQGSWFSDNTASVLARISPMGVCVSENVCNVYMQV